MNRILYFEGAGWDGCQDAGDVGNPRIRTAFKDNEGKRFYLEIGRAYRRAGRTISAKDDYNGLHIMHAFSIDTQEHILEGVVFGKDNDRYAYDYSKGDILRWVNANFDVSFDGIEVFDFFSGYFVHGGNSQNKYNLMDDHIDIPERTKARRLAFEEIDKHYHEVCRKNSNDVSKYSIVGLVEMDDDTLTARCHCSDADLGGEPRIRKVEVKYE